MDLTTLTIPALRKAFIEGSYTPLDLYNDARSHIESHNPEIGAYLELFDDAKETAEIATKRYAEEKEKTPPLLGMPIAVKNNILIKEKRVTAGSKILQNYIASYDATIITKLKEAGAIIMGSTNMDEFAMGSSGETSAYGITKNPIDTTRVPGGSSAGSAAALAMGGIVVAIGTDTGGSVRQPASLCGLVGTKPTYGSASRYGLIAMGSSLDQPGVFGHNVDDAALVQNIISGKDPYDSTTIDAATYPEVPKKNVYRIGIPSALIGEGVDPDVRDVFIQKYKALEEAGHEIVPIEMPLFEKGLAAYYIVMPAEVSSNLARFDGMRYGLHVEGKDLLEDYKKTRAEGFGAEVKRRILLGTYVLSSGYYDAYYGKAEQVRELMREEMNTLWESVDTILVPTSPVPAWKFGEKGGDPLSMYLADIFTVPVNLVGIPAISVPAGTVARDGVNLPVGVQCLCPLGGDERMFDVAKHIEHIVKK